MDKPEITQEPKMSHQTLGRIFEDIITLEAGDWKALETILVAIVSALQATVPEEDPEKQ